MRQFWMASWKAEGLRRTLYFTSLDKELAARIHLKLELERRKLPIPDAFDLERIGEPYEIRVASGS